MGESFAKGLRVLVVDDDEGTLELLRQTLSPSGMALDFARTLAAAQAARRDHSYDLLLVDWKLPDGSGVTLVQSVIDEGNDCEVVMMSAYANLESAVEAIRLRVADYLVKPFEIDALPDRLRRVTELQRLRRENRALVDDLRQKNARLEEMAVRDGLTGLFNHGYFQDRLEAEVRRSSRHAHELGLVFVDVDRFKEINDALGHQTGDRVLQYVADVLRGKSRISDTTFRLREHDLAARYGGDEFVLLLPETPKHGAAHKAERLRAYFAQHTAAELPSPVTISLGVAGYPTDGHDRESLIQAADAALYASKRLGRNRVVSYAPALAAGADVLDSLAATRSLAIERSIKERAFRFVYQPIVDARVWRMFGYEALCRPKDQDFAHAADVIAAAEGAGRIVDLGRLLRAMAIQPMQGMPEPLAMFVNLHPHELTDPRLLDEDSPLLPWAKRVVFELTESTAITDYRRVREVIARLRERGFRVGIDDLAAGYAGLNTLAQLDIDFVKLDRSLLANIRQETRIARLVKHVLEHALGEGILVIAEGIETQEECEVMWSMGCPLMQGYYFGKPEPSDGQFATRPSISSPRGSYP